jgi:hypothetical protein
MIRRRLLLSIGDAKTFNAAAPAALAASMAGAISSGFAIEWIEASMLRARAASRSTSKCACFEVLESARSAQHLPAFFHWPETAEEGGFAAYGPRFDQIIRELHARQVAQILRGGKVADIPVEQPTKFELVINLHTATAPGITVPPTLLALADKVID